MKLYYAPGTCALACWIALEWAGADYEVEKVDPKSDAYRTINPLGMVPAIDVGAGRAMTQADAILQYVVERYPDARLGADVGIDARFAFNETMAFLTGDFHPAFWPHFTPERFTIDQSDAALAAVRTAAQPRIERVLAHLDTVIDDAGHVHGGRRSVADAYAFVMTRWTEKLPKSWCDYPGVARLMERMAADPAVVRILDLSKR
jgi:glutathione S-transferase